MYYVMYLRKSRTDMDAEARGEGETLARHRHALHELAARNGHGIAREYAEVVCDDRRYSQNKECAPDVVNIEGDPIFHPISPTRWHSATRRRRRSLRRQHRN